MAQINNLRVGHCAWDIGDQYPVRRTSAPRRNQLKQQKFSGLDLTIEATVVPRLIATLKGSNGNDTQSQSTQVDAFAELALHHDVRDLCAAIENLRARGSSLEQIYLEVLAPTAYRLCSLWQSDGCGFADTTLGLWRLQEVLREFSGAFRSEFIHREHGLRVLLTPAPGRRHEIAYAMFGLALVAEFFLREGWDAWIEPDTSSHEFAETIRNQWFDAAAFLISGDASSNAEASDLKIPDALRVCARAIREVSPNASIGIMVCNQPIINTPEPVRLVDADLSTADTQQVSLMASRFLGSLVDQC